MDWRHLKAVVLESDDWGLCAWVPDEPAYAALADLPAWRSPSGHTYGRSTLERAEDVAGLIDLLLGFRGGDGHPPVWQANTVMATPDYSRLAPPRFECRDLPLVSYPEFPSRWQRPGMWDQVRRGMDAGVWWPELHGLVHLPQAAWLSALREGAADACRALEHQCFVCAAVEASAEYDPREPVELRTRALARAVAAFRDRFVRAPESLCAPDYRWDERLESDTEALGLTTLQGHAEQMGHPFPRARHVLARLRGPHRRGRRFYLPPRIAFEPRGVGAAGARLGPEAAHRAVRAAWGRGQPAVVSTHRVNYAHLDPAWSDAGYQALGDLLGRLAADGAIFLTDTELRSLHERGWSLRAIGERGALLRSRVTGGGRVRAPAPAGVVGVTVRDARGPVAPRLAIEQGELVAGPGACDVLLDWRFA